MSKKLAFFYVIAVVLIYNSYNYVNNQLINPFMIDASMSITESYTADLLHTKQDYSFSLVNTSDKTVKLINIELQGYQGIKTGALTISGKPLMVQEVKSDREYSSPNSWSTRIGLLIEYQVEILEPKIQNPKSALITYSYLGIKHKQEVNFPGGAAKIPEVTNTNYQGSVILIVIAFIAVILLIFIYRKREVYEPYLGLKLIGYYYLGAFNLNFNFLIPLGMIICLLLFRPRYNGKVKIYSALCGFTFMIVSYAFSQI